MDAGLFRAGSFVMLSIQLRFCIDAPSGVRSREALRQLTITDVGTAGRDIIKKLSKRQKTPLRPSLHKRVYFCEKENKNIYENY